MSIGDQLLARDPVAVEGGRGAFEIAEELGHPLFAEPLGIARRLGLLVLVIGIERDGVMRVVHPGDEIGDGELELDRPEQRRLVLRREIVRVGEPGEDMADLRQHQLAGIEIGRGERLERGARLHVPHQRLGAVLPRAIAIGDAGGLHRQADELAAALNARPIPEIVAHWASPGARARIANA